MAIDPKHSADVNPEVDTFVHLIKDTFAEPSYAPYDEGFEPPGDGLENFIPREEL
jgi:hypothetical protein